jgi:hypothetical protein
VFLLFDITFVSRVDEAPSPLTMEILATEVIQIKDDAAVHEKPSIKSDFWCSLFIGPDNSDTVVVRTLDLKISPLPAADSNSLSCQVLF